MNCPVCHSDTRVLDTRGEERRRECGECGHRFTTTEVLKDARRREQEAVRTVLEAAERLKAA